MCEDPPQIFDMRLAPEARAAERDRADCGSKPFSAANLRAVYD
jgi:hypothetical protein